MSIDSNCITFIKDLVDIAQGLVIISVTLFTAWWTFKTFAHKERIQELKELKKGIEEYHHMIQVFCIQVRDTVTPDNQEIQEMLQLVALHNKLVALASLNLYTKKFLRNRIQSIVGSWLADRRLELMQRRPGWETGEEERVKLWQQFECEYKEVKELIDEQADRLL
jgi:hypothetical protein